jgi:hypothetical protein
VHTRSAVAGLLLVLLGACTPAAPVTVPLAELVDAQEDHDGSLVITEGTVRTYDDPRHYWIEDAELNRVELVPHEAVEDLVGDDIRVEGRFSFRDDRGRVITVDELEVVAPRPRA